MLGEKVIEVMLRGSSFGEELIIQLCSVQFIQHLLNTSVVWQQRTGIMILFCKDVPCSSRLEVF